MAVGTNSAMRATTVAAPRSAAAVRAIHTNPGLLTRELADKLCMTVVEVLDALALLSVQGMFMKETVLEPGSRYREVRWYPAGSVIEDSAAVADKLRSRPMEIDEIAVACCGDDMERTRMALSLLELGGHLAKERNGTGILCSLLPGVDG